MSKLGIAAIQIEGELTDNIGLIEREARAVKKRLPWIDLIVFGELAAHGVSIALAEPESGAFETRMAALAAELEVYLIPGSWYQIRGGEVFNTACVFAPDGSIIARHDKFFPFTPYERGVSPGRDYCVFDIPGIGRLGLAICYDMWFPEAMRTLAAMGAEAIILPTMTNTIDRDVEVAIARANAAINQCYFIDVNCAGVQGNGRSVVFGPGGELLYESGQGRDVIALRLDMAEVREVRANGWHGLGQVLKSFRDAPLAYPFHESASARQAQLAPLGALEKPLSDRIIEKTVDKTAGSGTNNQG